MGKSDRLEKEAWEEQTSKTVERRSHGRADQKVPRYDGGFIDLANESVMNDAKTDSSKGSESKRDKTSDKNAEKSIKKRDLKITRKRKKKTERKAPGGKPSEEGFFLDSKLVPNDTPKETNQASSGTVNIIEIKSNRVQRIKQKVEQEKLDKINQTNERFESDNLREEQAEKLRREKLEEERQAAEKLRREKLEEERKAAEKLRREKLEEEKKAAEKLRREKLEEERQAAEKLRREKLEEEKKAAEKLRREKLEEEKKAAEKLRKEKLEEERQAAEKLRKERLAEERRAAKRLRREKLEKERQAAQRLRREKLEEERQVAEELQKEKLEKEKEAAEKLQKEEPEEEKQVAENLQKEKPEEERKARKKRSKDKLSKQEQNREQPATGKNQNRKGERGKQASDLTWEETRPPGSRKNNQRNRNTNEEKQIQGILVPTKTEREVDQPPPSKKQLRAAAKQKEKELKEPRKPMSKRAKRTLGLGIPAALFLSGYIVVSVLFMGRFIDRTYINGYDFSRATAGEVSSFFANKGETFTVEISGLAGLSETITGEELGLSISDNGQVMALLENQNSWAWPIRLLTGTEHHIDLVVEYNDDLLVERVDEIVCIDRDRTIEPVDAKPYFNGERFEIRGEVLGTLINPDIVISHIEASMSAYGNALDLREIGAYIRPNVFSDDPRLVASVGRLNHYVGSSITFDLNPKLVVVNHEQIVEWVSWDSNFNVTFHEEMAREFMNDFVAKYSTLGTTRTFTNPLGRTVEVESHYFGWDLDAETEMENFLSNIRNGETVTREPAYFTRGSFHEAGEWGDTFIQICKTDQHLWFFENGELVLESPVVTGMAGSSQTPTGVFEILWMASPTILRGPIIDQATGAREWESPVSYWMAITWCGVGLHDATWQPYFGGSRWTYGGSRGCINMPLGLAGELYHMVGEGTITIVHW